MLKNVNVILSRLRNYCNIQFYSCHVETADTNCKLAGQLTERNKRTETGSRSQGNNAEEFTGYPLTT